MKKMAVLLRRIPPKRELITLDAIAEDWTMRFIEGVDAKRRDLVVDFCQKANSWEEAVRRACNSRNELGKKHNHQSKVRQPFLDNFASIIVRYETFEIKNFDELHDWLEQIAPKGIGPVTIYDVATRIGAYLNMEPQSLYIHAGVKIGWEILHGRTYEERIPRERWPEPLRHLPADQVEDLLCAYREFLRPTMVQRAVGATGVA